MAKYWKDRRKARFMTKIATMEQRAEEGGKDSEDGKDGEDGRDGSECVDRTRYTDGEGGTDFIDDSDTTDGKNSKSITDFQTSNLVKIMHLVDMAEMAKLETIPKNGTDA